MRQRGNNALCTWNRPCGRLSCARCERRAIFKAHKRASNPPRLPRGGFADRFQPEATDEQMPSSWRPTKEITTWSQYVTATNILLALLFGVIFLAGLGLIILARRVPQ